jgi:hypothetical protein
MSLAFRVAAEEDPVVSGCLVCGDPGFLALDFLKKPGSSRVMCKKRPSFDERVERKSNGPRTGSLQFGWMSAPRRASRSRGAPEAYTDDTRRTGEGGEAT